MDLDLRRVIGSIQGSRPQEELAALITEWGDEVLAASATDSAYVPYGNSHPRPLMARERWQSLNGWWECAFVPCGDAAAAWRDASAPQVMDGRILVPFSPEARLSGVGRQLQPNELLWYRREVAWPGLAAGERCLLHLDGVDFACSVRLDGKVVALHEGAYLPFVVDVTDEVMAGAHVLELCVFDPSDTGTQLRGKQRLARGTMWYTAQSGVWKDVWLEVVPQAYVESLRLVPDADAGAVMVEVAVAVAPGPIPEAAVAVGGVEVPLEPEAPSAYRAKVLLGEVRLWAPDDPFLYPVRVRVGQDEVASYCAFRTIAVEPDPAGVPRICLNHEPLMLRGLLDQGYWPDGLLTPPSVSAVEADIVSAREMGFNLLRKHIKVETDRWYAACDRLGMLVWQDMPSGGSALSDWQTQQKPTLFSRSWSHMRDDSPAAWKKLASGDLAYREEWLRTCDATVSRLGAHPCVVGWVVFNESWGQFCAALQTARVRRLDGTRPILSASGWYDQGSGDLFGVHNYFRGMHAFADPYVRGDSVAGLAAPPECGRAFVLSEFGGLTLHVDGHSSLARAYGYAAFDDADAWRVALGDLLSRADELWDQGLAGFVYTQLTDVEEETNGLLTYDRRVCKLAWR